METFGWVSVLPPVIAIALAIWSKQVYLSLGLFIWMGWTIMNSWNPVAGLVQSVDTMGGAVGGLGWWGFRITRAAVLSVR